MLSFCVVEIFKDGEDFGRFTSADGTHYLEFAIHTVCVEREWADLYTDTNIFSLM